MLLASQRLVRLNGTTTATHFARGRLCRRGPSVEKIQTRPEVLRSGAQTATRPVLGCPVSDALAVHLALGYGAQQLTPIVVTTNSVGTVQIPQPCPDRASPPNHTAQSDTGIHTIITTTSQERQVNLPGFNAGCASRHSGQWTCSHWAHFLTPLTQRSVPRLTGVRSRPWLGEADLASGPPHHHVNDAASPIVTSLHSAHVRQSPRPRRHRCCRS